jgi:hypothetical protein
MPRKNSTKPEEFSRVRLRDAGRMGTPIWSHDGIICTGESYKNVVKLILAKGASLKHGAYRRVESIAFTRRIFK